MPEHGEDGRVANGVPMIPAPTSVQQSELASQLSEIAALDARLAGTATWEPGNEKEITSLTQQLALEIGAIRGTPLLKSAGAADGIVGNAAPVASTAKIAAKEMDFSKPEGATLMLWLKPGAGNPRDAALLSAIDYSGNPADAQYGRGRDLRLIDGEIEYRESARFPVYALIVRSKGAGIRAGEWRHVAVTVSKGIKAGLIRIFIDGCEIPTRVRYDGLSGDVAAREFLIGADNSAEGARFHGELDEARHFASALNLRDVRGRFWTAAGA